MPTLKNRERKEVSKHLHFRFERDHYRFKLDLFRFKLDHFRFKLDHFRFELDHFVLGMGSYPVWTGPFPVWMGSFPAWNGIIPGLNWIISDLKWDHYQNYKKYFFKTHMWTAPKIIYRKSGHFWGSCLNFSKSFFQVFMFYSFLSLNFFISVLSAHLVRQDQWTLKYLHGKSKDHCTYWIQSSK